MQVLIRWSLQKGVAVIPKTTKAVRVEENLGAFKITLDAQDMAVLDAMDCNMRVTWDPTNVV